MKCNFFMSDIMASQGMACRFGLFFRSSRYQRALASWGRDMPITAEGTLSGQRKTVETLWQEFFSDPFQWWDQRPEKGSATHPDFKHKKTHEGLWLNGKFNPPWVESELAAMAPGIIQSSTFSWNRKLTGYVKAGKYEKTMELFQQMQREGMRPDRFTFVPVLNACARLRELEEGRRIHAHVLRSGCDLDAYVGSSLVDMYAKCGSIDDAQRVFNKMQTRNVVTWNVMILGYAKCVQGKKALELHQIMLQEGVEPDPATFVALLQACSSLKALEDGRHFHKQIIQRGLSSNIFVASSLIDMYAKCGSMDDSWRVFNSMAIRNAVAWNSIIQGYVKCGQGQKALELSRLMTREEVEPDSQTFVGLLNACASTLALEDGRHIHEKIVQSGCESNVYVGSALVDMYAKCGSIEDARRVFHNMPSRNVVSWNAIIQGHVKCGQEHVALELWQQMQQEGVKPDSVTFVGLLNACAILFALKEGRRVHGHIIRRGLESDGFVGCSLVNMYAKCGCIEDARRVFKKMSTRDVVSWNAMILGSVKCGQGLEALELHELMQGEYVEPNSVTFVGLLNACALIPAIDKGRHIHEQIIQSGCESDVFVGSSLVDMYAKCGSIEDAERVFRNLPTRCTGTWNAMILGYTKCGQGQKALELSRQMQQEGLEADRITFVGILNACASIGAPLDDGRNAHKQVIKQGYESDVLVGSSLVDMYAKCGSIEDAWMVFNSMPSHNVVSWSAMINGYVKYGQGQRALELSQQMRQEGVEPDPGTFVGLLNACASVSALKEGRLVHEQIIQRHWEYDVFIGSSLVDMYVKCGSIEDAWRVFNNMPVRNAVSWNAMILGLVKIGQGKKALELTQQMQGKGVDPDSFTFVAALSACASLGALEEGKHIHQQIIKRGCESNVYLANSLIHMYAKCGRIEDAQRVFNYMPKCNVVSWNTMILGYVKSGEGQKALELSQHMSQEGVEPDPITFVGFLNACASLAALEEGRCVHEQIIRRGWESDVFVGNSLIDMYSKCGSLEDAWRVFSKMPTRDNVSWTAMLGAYAMHGHGKEALGHFESMCQEVVEINSVAFVSLLSACSHAGQVDEGLHYFELMSSVNNISATVEHYACIVDLLGRAGRTQEAEDLLNQMACEPDATVWMALLGACRVHGHVEMGERIAKRVLDLDSGNAGCYMLLSNIYAAAGDWLGSARVQQQRLVSVVRNS